jgi:hypothetical protein
MKPERKPTSFNIEKELMAKVRNDALTRSIENGNNVSQSDIMNDILSRYYSKGNPVDIPPSLPDSKPPTEHIDNTTVNEALVDILEGL